MDNKNYLLLMLSIGVLLPSMLCAADHGAAPQPPPPPPPWYQQAAISGASYAIASAVGVLLWEIGKELFKSDAQRAKEKAAQELAPRTAEHAQAQALMQMNANNAKMNKQLADEHGNQDIYKETEASQHRATENLQVVLRAHSANVEADSKRLADAMQAKIAAQQQKNQKGSS